MRRYLLAVLTTLLLLVFPAGATPDADPWIARDADGSVRVRLHFFWSLRCPHCTAAHPYIAAIPAARPWVELHAYELSRDRANLARYAELARAVGAEATAVPALIFCGEMLVGWDDDAGTGELLRQRLDACRARAVAGTTAAPAAAATTAPLRLPLFGSVDPARLSLPLLTLVLAGLDAFNPCAFFVLLFLLSMLAHQRSRLRMLLTGGVFVAVSGLMYFAFMAAWLGVFALFGHLGEVTLVAGALALLVGLLNVKDWWRPGAGPTLSIPASRKPDLFRRGRAILAAASLPAMLAATTLLAIAANFYELLCTAGLPMVYTRLLTLAEPSPAARYAWLAAYNLIYVLPLAAIVAVVAGRLGSRRLSEREGRLLKLLSGTMMLGLGLLLLLAPERAGDAGMALALLATAVAVTVLAARYGRR